MNSVIILIVSLLTIHISEALRNTVLSTNHVIDSNGEDVGERLFLTPYIEKGNIKEALKLSQVNGLPNAPSVNSYSGYLTVNKTHNSNTFFWFFPALNKAKNAPIILWLQGGPGGSALVGMFTENGPLVMLSKTKADLRKYSWNEEFSLLYIDNPVGAGFSFTDKTGYAKDNNDVARDLYEALQQFFTLFSEQRNNEFYVAAESYGGKFAVALADKIHTEGTKSNITFKGIAVGNGWFEGETQVGFGEFLFQTGLVDENQRDLYNNAETDMLKLIKDKQYIKALDVLDKVMFSRDSYYNKYTQTHIYNYLTDHTPADTYYYGEYLELADTRKAIHVGNQTFADSSDEVFEPFSNDYMQSVKPLIVNVMENYKVMIYSGQLDVMIPAVLVERFVDSIKWSKSEQYKNADRIVWKVDSKDPEVAGYVTQVDKFLNVIVRNGGHILPYDQPRVCLDMITRFIRNKPFN